MYSQHKSKNARPSCLQVPEHIADFYNYPQKIIWHEVIQNIQEKYIFNCKIQRESEVKYHHCNTLLLNYIILKCCKSVVYYNTLVIIKNG